MNQSFKAFFYFYKHAEVNNAGDFAHYIISDFVFFYDFFFIFKFRTFLGEYQFSFFWRRPDDDDRYSLSDELFQFVKNSVFVAVSDSRIMLGFKLGSRQESRNTLPIQDKSAFIGFIDQKVKHCFVFYGFFGFAPYHRLSGLLERKFYVSVIIFNFNHFRGNDVSWVYFFYYVSRADKLSSVNYTGAVRLKVHIQSGFFYSDNRPFHQISNGRKIVNLVEDYSHQIFFFGFAVLFFSCCRRFLAFFQIINV